MIIPNQKRKEKRFLDKLEGKYLKGYRNNILRKTDDPFSYPQYWQPLEKMLKKVEKVYFSPDGVYNQINLNTLQNPKTKKYILDEIDVELVTNTKDLLVVRAEEPFNKFALLFGDPDYGMEKDDRRALVSAAREKDLTRNYELNLEQGEIIINDLPGTRLEVEAIAAMLDEKGWQVSTYLKEQALEENIKDNFKPRVLHIATHGYFEKNKKTGQNNPLLRSGLLLTGAANSMNTTQDQEDQLETDSARRHQVDGIAALERGGFQ